MHAAEALRGAGGESFDVVVGRDVDARGEHLGLVPDLRRGLLDTRFVDVGHHHAHPLGREPLGERKPDPARGAGDDGGAAGEVVHQPDPDADSSAVLRGAQAEHEGDREAAGVRSHEHPAGVRARREEPGDRLARLVEDARAVVDRDAVEREGDRRDGLDHVERRRGRSASASKRRGGSSPPSTQAG